MGAMNYSAPFARYLCDVVVIEDFKDLADVLAESLRESGLSVQVALDGGSALEIARHSTARVALVDYMLPDVTGIDLVARLRKQWPNTEFILLSGNIGGVSADLAQSLGIRMFLNKPVPMRALCKAVHQLLRMPRSAASAGTDQRNWLSLGIGSPRHHALDPTGNVVQMPLAPFR